MQHVHLAVNRELIDAKFEGYKVSIDNIHVASKTLDQSICMRSPSKDMVTFQHVKLFSNSNNLFFNSAKSSSDQSVEHFYRILETGHIQRITYNKLTPNWDTLIVARIELEKGAESGYPVNLLFTDKDISVVCDGKSIITVYLMASETNWVKMVQYDAPHADGLGLIEARVFGHKLEILAQSIENEDGKSFNKIQWITVGLEDIDFAEQLTVMKTVNFIQRGHFETCTFGNDGSIIFLSSEKPKLESDDFCNGYKWAQEDNVIKITFDLKTSISEEDIELKLTKAEICLDIKGSTILTGNLYGDVDADDVEIRADPNTNTLELLLKPTEKSEWKDLLSDKKRGVIINHQEVFGAEQSVEECDEAESSLFVHWIDPNSGKVFKQCDVSGCQVLFHRRNCVSPATVCLRHDVDGLLVSLDEPRHLNTLQAFGYVQASKLNRFWSGTSTTNKFACIVENTNRVLLYSQKVGIEGTLSNRKTSSKVGHVAKQYLFRIECSDPVQGVHLTDDHLFAITKNQVHVAKLP